MASTKQKSRVPSDDHTTADKERDGVTVRDTPAEDNDLFGFPLDVLRLARRRHYDQAEVAMMPYTSDGVPVAQRVMNMRLLRKFLEKQRKLQEASDMAMKEVNTAISTDDPVLMSNVIGSAASFVLRHSTYEAVGQLVHAQRVKVAPFLEEVNTPFAAISITSAHSFLVSTVIRKLLRMNINSLPDERKGFHELVIETVPEFLDSKMPDFLHLLQVDGEVKDKLMPFSFVLAHYEFAEFERRIKREHHYGLSPEQWLVVARARASNLSDTHMGMSEEDHRRSNWLMLATMLPGHEGEWSGGDNTLEFLESYRLAMIIRTQIEVTTDVMERTKLYLESREIEDRYGLDWPFYEDQGIISDFF